MENQLTISVANISPVWGDKERNFQRIADFMREAKQQGAQLVVFPELMLTGYDLTPNIENIENDIHCELAEPLDGTVVTELDRLTKELHLYTVFGMPERDEETGKIYNAAVILSPDKTPRSYRKLHLPFTESRWASRGDAPLLIETPFGLWGIGICYDTYAFPELTRFARAMGARLFINCTAVGTVVTADNVRTSVEYLSANNCIFIASANIAGDEWETSFLGGSSIVGPSGDGPAVKYYGGYPFDSPHAREQGLYTATIDLSLTENSHLAKQWDRNAPDWRPQLYLDMYRSVLEQRQQYKI